MKLSLLCPQRSATKVYPITFGKSTGVRKAAIDTAKIGLTIPDARGIISARTDKMCMLIILAIM